jgi:hypothetical protein
MVEAPSFPERMTKTAQVLSSLNENFFDFFDFAVKKFCGARIAHRRKQVCGKVCGKQVCCSTSLSLGVLQSKNSTTGY